VPVAATALATAGHRERLYGRRVTGAACPEVDDLIGEFGAEAAGVVACGVSFGGHGGEAGLDSVGSLLGSVTGLVGGA
jgi:hypothetical protein